MKQPRLIAMQLLLSFAVPAHAQEWQPPSGMTTPITELDQVNGILLTILGWMFTFAMIGAVMSVIYAAFLYLTAAGNEKNVQKAKSVLMYAIIAVVIGLMAAGIEKIVFNLLNT